MIEFCPNCGRPFTAGNEQTPDGYCEVCAEAMIPYDGRSQPRQLDRNSYLPSPEEIAAGCLAIQNTWSESEECRRRGDAWKPYVIEEASISVGRRICRGELT